jgi:hypothetical protein
MAQHRSQCPVIPSPASNDDIIIGEWPQRAYQRNNALGFQTDNTDGLSATYDRVKSNAPSFDTARVRRDMFIR